jgi:Na+/melibiose symporter-like transporter
MALWALYWNFLSYGLYNFVGSTPEKEHATNWGILDIFKGLGLIVAPVVASLALKGGVTPLIFGVSLVFLFLVYIFYSILVKISDEPKKISAKQIDRVDYARFWKVARVIAPILVMDVLLAVFDMSFSTIGPLISESLKGPHALGGLFLTLYYLPTVIMLWLAGPITQKFGKKKTAFVGFSIGALGIGTFALFGKGLILLPLVFITSMISSLAWPAIKGCFADYITRYPAYEREIEILTSFFGNIGCIIGPIVAGFLAEQIGDIQALSAIGVVCGTVTLIVWSFTPRKIKII